MKQYLFNPLKPFETIWNLIKRGILRIFPLPQGVIAFAIVIALTSCTSMHHVPTVPIETIRSDTLYLSNTQYDSIYILQDKYVDRTHDTLYIRDSSIEYRYRMLRDTIRLVQCDSIPYEVTITEIKQVTRPPTSFDHLTRLTFWIVIGFLLCSIGFKLKRFFKR